MVVQLKNDVNMLPPSEYVNLVKVWKHPVNHHCYKHNKLCMYSICMLYSYMYTVSTYTVEAMCECICTVYVCTVCTMQYILYTVFCEYHRAQVSDSHHQAHLVALYEQPSERPNKPAKPLLRQDLKMGPELSHSLPISIGVTRMKILHAIAQSS